MGGDKPQISTATLYAFRVHHIIPIDLFEQYAHILSIAGIETEARGNKIALFFS